MEGQSFARGQLRSYMRTPVNFFVAQLLSQQGTPCIVMGTGNYGEAVCCPLISPAGLYAQLAPPPPPTLV